ncbi:MAG TPA: hypothetical protein VI029_06360, partial [Mycobacterium sp.]
MTSVSARSYVAAGLATAIAGVAVASPVLAQSEIHLPAVSDNVDLASEVSSATQHAVSTGTIEVKQIGDAVRHVMASAPHEAATAATALPGGPLIRKAAATAVTRAVTAVVAANPAGSVTVHRDSASSPAVTAALPSLRGILGIPALALAIPVDSAEGVLDGADEATLGLGNVLFGLGTGDNDTVRFGINEIASAIPDGINEGVSRVTSDVQAIASALGFNFDAADRAALAGVAKVADAKNPGAVNVAKPDDATKPDTTKPATTKPEATKPGTTKSDTTPESTKPDTTKPADAKPADTKSDTTKPSNHSTTAEHHTGAATVKDAGDKGATKAGASAHNGHTPGA